MASEGKRNRVTRYWVLGVLLVVGIAVLAAVVLPVCRKAGERPMMDSISGLSGDAARRAPAPALPTLPQAPPGPRASAGAPERAASWLTTASAAAAVPTRPMLIFTASMGLRVKDYEKAEAEVQRLTEKHGGFISGSQTSTREDGGYGTVTVRVPADHLQKLMDEVSALGKVISKELETQEVTEEFVDLQARLRNDQRGEEQLLRLLAKAGRVSDLLQVEKVLAEVRGRIEQITGRLRYLENRVALATLTIVIEEESGATAPIATWSPWEVGKRAVAGLLATLRVVASALIWVIAFAPIWLVVVIVWWVVRRRSAATTSGA